MCPPAPLLRDPWEPVHVCYLNKYLPKQLKRIGLVNKNGALGTIIILGVVEILDDTATTDCTDINIIFSFNNLHSSERYSY